ncbi:MAG TPA: glycosyltransferase family A protein [Thermoanaerobaculia bacterium]|jgi:hypothetical protein|nr:glycosyltransferase family A protein [Thermoanaerobaculia bacterium]
MTTRDSGSPLVSVIVPIRGRFALAQQTLLSVARQTYRPIELIVVDDASEPAFVASPQAPGIDLRRIRLDTNVGPGAAREAGRTRARGELLAYLDSDDLWGSTHLASLVAALSAAPDAGMAYTAALEISLSDPPRLRAWSDVPCDRILPVLLWRRPWHTSACLWRRELTEAIGAWLPIWHYEDYAHDCRAGCLGARLTHVPEPTCFIQTDAPGRLSTHSNERRKVESYGLAVLSMAEGIRQVAGSRGPGDARMRRRVREILLGAAAKTAEHDLGTLSARIVLELWRWRKTSASLALASGVGLPLSLMSAGHLSARIFRWARSQSADEVGETSPALAAEESPLLELGGGPDAGRH